MTILGAKSSIGLVCLSLAAGGGGLSLTLRVALGALASWFVPERWWAPLTRAVGTVATRTNSSRDGQVERIAGHATRLYGLRAYLLSNRRPCIEAVGDEHVRRALEDGDEGAKTAPLSVVAQELAERLAPFVQKYHGQWLGAFASDEAG